jgi:hypothetical protein
MQLRGTRFVKKNIYLDISKKLRAYLFLVFLCFFSSDCGKIWGTVTFNSLSPYAQTVLNDGPIAYWRVGESLGPTAIDISGNNYNGTYSATGITYGVAGAIAQDPNTAITCDGVAGQVAATLTSVNTTPSDFVTVEFWMNWTGAAGGTPFNFSNQYSLSFSGTVHFGFHTFNGLDVYGISAAGLANQWLYVVGVFQNSNVSGSQLYINGVSQALSQFGVPVAHNVNSSIDFCGTTGTFYSGSLDEIAVYNYALSSAQIQNHYNVGIQ